MRNGMIIDKYGNKRWYQNDLLHRTDGPAIEYADGDKMWYQNNLLHRTDGPAVEYADCYKSWYQRDLLHRTDGPAVEYADGDKRWYIEDYEYDLNDWLNLVNYTEPQKTLMRLQYA
jgi:hypothetical protein